MVSNKCKYYNYYTANSKDRINLLKWQNNQCNKKEDNSRFVKVGAQKIKTASTVINPSKYYVSKNEYIKNKIIKEMKDKDNNCWVHKPSNNKYQINTAASSSQRVNTLKHITTTTGVSRRLQNDIIT